MKDNGLLNRRQLGPDSIEAIKHTNATIYHAKDGGPINFGARQAKQQIAAAKAARKAERRKNKCAS